MTGTIDPSDLPKQEIVFEKVGFRYPNQQRSVFEDFNLRINIGESLGIVGVNGAGKTTLIKLRSRSP